MAVEDNKAAVQRMGEEAFNQGNLDVLDELVAQDVVDHDPTPGQASGREGIKQFVSTLRTAFPDLQLAVENMVAEGDYVAFNYTINGTHQGERHTPGRVHGHRAHRQAGVGKGYGDGSNR